MSLEMEIARRSEYDRMLESERAFQIAPVGTPPVSDSSSSAAVMYTSPSVTETQSVTESPISSTSRRGRGRASRRRGSSRISSPYARRKRSTSLAPSSKTETPVSRAHPEMCSMLNADVNPEKPSLKLLEKMNTVPGTRGSFTQMNTMKAVANSSRPPYNVGCFESQSLLNSKDDDNIDSDDNKLIIVESN